ncbi:uncharacterized protein BO96DRAFT_347338, partial [Aspergillus niger CBS 101883]
SCNHLWILVSSANPRERDLQLLPKLRPLRRETICRGKDAPTEQDRALKAYCIYLPECGPVDLILWDPTSYKSAGYRGVREE